MQYLITPLLEVLNPTNTVSRNRLLSFAIGNMEAEIYNCLSHTVSVTEAVIVTEPVISETEMSEAAEFVTEAAEITESATA